MSAMGVYVCTDHAGHYPVGVCSVIIARSEEEAGELLRLELRDHGLNPDEKFTLRRLNSAVPKAFILLDGDY